ncbi:MAG: MoaD/ThiS family protein [Micavibrio sp.]
MKITIHHYGAFRKIGSKTDLEVPAPATIGAVRAALAAQMGEQHKLLIEDSVLANDTDILPDEFIISDSCALSVLPPVCGG